MAMRESSRRLSEAINKTLSDANKGGQHITGGDEIRIEIAVSSFVRKNFHWRYSESAPTVEDLPERVERAIWCFCKSVSVHGAGMKALCSQLAEWINANYQRVPGRSWRGLGRGFPAEQFRKGEDEPDGARS